MRTAAFVALALVGVLAQGQQLRLRNPLAVDRGEEVVEVPVAAVLEKMQPAKTHFGRDGLDHIVVRDIATHAALASQLYSSKYGEPADVLLLLVHLGARGSQTVTFAVEAKTPEVRPRVFGREAPERKDDFAWENEYVTYRVYGPALQATGEITSGIDVWSKRVPNLVIDSFYKRDAEGARTHNPAMSYHRDNGAGLDSYLVGPTRGCGGTAVLDGGKLMASKNYTANRILASGPIRFAFELTYAPWQASGTEVRETKRVVLDAGTHLNRITSTYEWSGATELDLAAGVAVHEGAAADFPLTNQVASVWDTPQDASAGRIATGLVAAPGQQAKTLAAAGHALLVFHRRSGEPFVYLAGSGWSKGDMPTAEAWGAYLTREAEKLAHPVELGWVKR